MLQFYKRYARTVFDIALIILTVYLIMVIFSYLYSIAKPIFIGFVIFLLIHPFVQFLRRRGLKPLLATSIAMFLFIAVLLGVVVTGGIIFTTEVYQLSLSIPTYFSLLQEEVIKQVNQLRGSLENLPTEYVTKLQQYMMLIAEKSSQFLSSFFLSLFRMLTSIPALLFNFGMGLILSFFLSLEYDNLQKMAKEKTPKTFMNAFTFLRENVLKGILLYLKAQLKLISFTFLIIFIGLLILRVGNAFSISLLAAIFDLLPILGVSTLFIPWIIYLLIVKNFTLALWITLLWLVVILFRQFAEPKIMGETLGVSAFTMLSFVILSTSLFGVAGLILSPILVILMKALYDHGYFARWIHLPEGEYDTEGDPLPFLPIEKKERKVDNKEEKK
ncbi:Sporulation integral membrane protein YtvI [[Clostridium] ultunense Esp]|nr:Sporulation integral membrane protein YtvI [[Clostridium] ultunense Esp]